MTPLAIDTVQLADAVLMVRPSTFGQNPQTAESNAFQQTYRGAHAELGSQILGEFDAMTESLDRAGIQVIVAQDLPRPPRPDAVFPNNWVSFHGDGTVILYPMEAPNRRLERRLDIIESLSVEHGFSVREILDLSGLENDGLFLEGTGSLVLDRVGREAYAALSSRTQVDALADFAQHTSYALTLFDAVGPAGLPIYHTNVMMALGDSLAIICAESIADGAQRHDVLEHLHAGARDVVMISTSQMQSFAGNMLQLMPRSGESLIVLSERAFASLDRRQRVVLERHGELLVQQVGSIETVGGGSVRCMMAEIFLPRLSTT